jgi:hypothetical protein
LFKFFNVKSIHFFFRHIFKLNQLPVKMKIKDMSYEELKAYKKEKQKERRELLSEENKIEIKEIDRRKKTKTVGKFFYKLIEKDRMREVRRNSSKEE